MFELKREHIDYDPETKIPTVYISVKIADPNGMLLKAKAEYVSSTIELLMKTLEAQEALYAEIYSEELLKEAHHFIAFDKDPFIDFISRKNVHSKEVKQALLNKAFE